MSELDSRLASESRIEPSSGFVGSVMDAVREAAAEPPPLPFPWRRYVTCVAICLVACVATTLAILRPAVLILGNPAFAAFAPALTFASAGLVLAAVTVRLSKMWLS